MRLRLGSFLALPRNASRSLAPFPGVQEGDEFSLHVAKTNQSLATGVGILFFAFACVGATAAFFSAIGHSGWVYLCFAVTLAAGAVITRMFASWVQFGEFLILLTAYAWLVYEMFQPGVTPASDLADFTVALFVVSLFRYMPPLTALIFDVAMFAPCLLAMIRVGFDLDVFISALFVMSAAYFSHLRLYRGAYAEFRTGKLLVELELKSRELERLSSVDPLTGLLNRRSFETTFTEWAQNADVPALSLLLYDIDHFKRYNDAHGHLSGDECIRQVVLAVDEVLSGDALAFRMGGEEFAIITKCTLAEATALADQILSQVRARCPVTVSLGVAQQSGRSQSLESLYSLADQALYGAKANGRNRLVCAESSL